MARQPRTRRPTRATIETTDATETGARTDTTTTETRTIPHLDLAAEALLDDWTREQVIAALIGRVKRDQGYLTYRKACNRRTSYDCQVQQDIRVLSLAAVWLAEETESVEGKAT